MKLHNLIATAAALLLTVASLSAVNFNVDSRQPPAAKINGSKITTLPAVDVYPDADTLRAAALTLDAGAAGLVTAPLLARLGEPATGERFSLIGAQLAMPYYSFGNTFGRISKE